MYISLSKTRPSESIAENWVKLVKYEITMHKTWFSCLHYILHESL